MGKFILLECECGFKTNRARIGSLLSHETSLGGFTTIDATYDCKSHEIVMHYATLPPEVESNLDRKENDASESAANQWFDDQREAVRKQHGELLTPSDHAVATNHACPDCGRYLQLITDGSWIA